MSIRALRTLIAIHRHGSFRAAAEAEYLTPAAVSQQMRQLERSWNLALFDRSSRTPSLTETGLALVDEAEVVVAAYDTLADKARSTDDVSGELVLGAVPTTLTGLVPLALSQLKACYPRVKVRVVPGLSNQLMLEIERGRIQAALVSRPEVLPPSLTFSEVVQEPLVLLVSQNTPPLPPKDLLQTQPFIRFNRDAVVGRQIEAWLQSNGIRVKDVMELEGLEAISSMVAAGLGLSIVPERCVRADDHLPLRTMSLGADGPKRTLGLVSKSGSTRTAVINATEASLLEAVSIGRFEFSRTNDHT
ncbi:MAG: LysR family transcriptional regulator [Tateyamaria sp.]